MSARLSLKVEKNILEGLSDRAEKLLRGVVSKTAFDIEAHAKREIQTGSKTGRIYKKKRTTTSKKRGSRTRVIEHRASAPGEAPATDTGNLVNSIQTTASISGPIAAEVSVGAEYGAALEFGTSKAAPRPFIAPAVDAQHESFQRGIAAAIRKAAQG